jgi:hypothetical protein
MSEPILFGECAICRQGLLVAVKDNASGKLLLMCDDCESQWDSPESSCSFSNALTFEIKAVRNATEDDVQAAGWSPYER